MLAERARGEGARKPSDSNEEAMSERIEVRAKGFEKVEAFVSEVLVTLGQVVDRDEVLLRIEAEKVSFDQSAPVAGRIAELLVTKNGDVHEGDLLVVLERTAIELPRAPASAPAAPRVGVSSDYHASPWIRSLARERDLDLSQIEGTGPHGRIVEADLLSRAPSVRETPLPSATEVHTPEAKLVLVPPSTESRQLSTLQRTVARAVTRTWTEVPHVTQFDESDVTELEAFRVALNREPRKEGSKLSLLPFIVKACACALRAFPDFNGSLAGEELTLNRDVNIGFAVDTGDGLKVPVIQQADRLSVLQIAGEIARLGDGARAAKLISTDTRGGTFTVSNLGGVGGTAFTPIINGHELAILGVSKAELKPKWDGAAFVPRLMLPLSLSYDHRVINGVAGARFIAHLGALLTDLRRALL